MQVKETKAKVGGSTVLSFSKRNQITTSYHYWTVWVCRVNSTDRWQDDHEGFYRPVTGGGGGTGWPCNICPGASSIRLGLLRRQYDS